MTKKKFKKIPNKNKNDDKIVKSIQKRIYEFLSKNNKKQFNYIQISDGINLEIDKEKDLLLLALKNLVKEEKILEKQKGKYILDQDFEQSEGIIDITSNGNAYLISEVHEEDIFISKYKKGNAFHGDKVLVKHTEYKGKAEGEVIEVLERKSNTFVGTVQYKENNNFAFVVPINNRIHVDFFVKEQYLNGAKDKDKVVVELLEWQEKNDNPRGKIIEVLGQSGEHETEIHAILAEYNLPNEFPEEVEKEATEMDISIAKSEVSNRRDMRQTTTFTIDPKDAKDFDDALSIKELENNQWEIGIHIADVSHYVQPNTLLDKEAFARATSIYLVDRVVPMLPEILSNNVCSLRPKEDKLTFSAVFTIDNQAKIVDQWFGRTVIHSDHRFSYEEAQQIIEDNDTSVFLGKEVLKLNELAKILRKNRMKSGAINFDRLEVKFELDENNFPKRIYFKHSKESNHLIEEFMLLANKKVSEFVSLKADGSDSGNTFVYRVHDEPNAEKISLLKNFIKPFGYNLDNRSKETLNKSINALLQEIKDSPEENMIETLVLRSMSKAIYTTDNLGHYGLSFGNYSHFTSPIRRYPDLIAHRLLQHYLDGKKSPDSAKYEADCKHCSAREKLASDAERDSIKFMQVKLMQEHIGSLADGIISGVTDWGIFVQLPANLAEGLIRLKSIEDDHYVFDSTKYAILGRKKGKIFQLGDRVRIRIEGADLEKKQLDFVLIEKLED